MKPTVLIIDDDEEIRTQMKWALVEDYDVLMADSRDAAMSLFGEHSPKLVLLDLGLPPHPNQTTEGMAILRELKSKQPETRIIIISGQSDRENAVRAIESGAHDFLPKPIETEELKVLLRRAAFLVELAAENRLAKEATPEDQGFEGMIGTSPAMQKVYRTLRKVAEVDAPVLLLGESGTGKEMAARAIHLRSERKNKPFVAINCGAIPENLLESELFGHEKGAFTGAHAQRKGRVESAESGTLFLDEIGELPLALQVKLLRFLQERKIERVGGRVSINVDVRIVAATNQDLEKAVQEGRFREDLYYRIAVVNVVLPPLRDRPGDAVLLAKAFIEQFASEHGRPSQHLTQGALRALEHHAWPGNVRELQNVMKRAFIMVESPSIHASDLGFDDKEDNRERPKTLKEGREEIERAMVEEALKRNAGKISHAANDLGISRPTLYELMQKLGLRGE